MLPTENLTVGRIDDHLRSMYRRRGLAAAVSLAALHALRGLGAALALVNPRGDEAYPAPGLLYRSIGFHPVDRTITYARPRKG